MNKSQAIGYILWSKRKEVEYKQHAYSDTTKYLVPIVGEFNRDRVTAALAKRFNTTGRFTGSSAGSCTVYLEDYNPETREAMVMFSYYIGD
jgi:hypothetical protein